MDIRGDQRSIRQHGRRQEHARILAEIDAATLAAHLALAAYSITSNHAFLERRMEMIAEHKVELDEILGEDEATALFVAHLEKAGRKADAQRE